MDHERSNMPVATTSLISPGSKAAPMSPPPRETGTRRFPRPPTQWTFEVACALLSVGAIVAIAGVLKVYDRQPLSRWNLQVAVNGSPVQISLNSVVSVLGTLAKSTMAVVLSSALCQSKWNWFMERSRPLQDFEVFDRASHGPLGGLKLIWRTRARRIASLGAFLVVLNLTFDPFLQLLISYREGQLDLSDSSNVALSRSVRYTGGALRTTGHTSPTSDGVLWPNTFTTDDNSMARAINNALWNVDNRLFPHYTCSTGNCTWPVHVSLAVCSTCHDVTGNIAVDSQDNGAYVTYKFPRTSTLTLTYNRSGDATNDRMGMNMTGTFQPVSTFNFQKSQTLLHALLALYVDPEYLDFEKNLTWSDSAVHATECGLQFCANTYNSSVLSNDFGDSILDTWSERVPTSYSVLNDSYAKLSYVDTGTGWNPLGPATIFYTPRTDFAITLNSRQSGIQGVSSFQIPQSSIHSLIALIRRTFVTVTDPRLPSRSSSVHENAGAMQYDTPTVQALWAGGSLNGTFDRLATDMSAVIRSGQADSTDNTNKPKAVMGYASDVIVQVRWYFLTVPLLVCVLGVLFLAVVVIQTMLVHTPVWKDSSLAGLVWGLDHESQELARDAWRVSGIKGRQTIRVKFQGDRAEGELMRMK